MEKTYGGQKGGNGCAAREIEGFARLRTRERVRAFVGNGLQRSFVETSFIRSIQSIPPPPPFVDLKSLLLFTLDPYFQTFKSGLYSVIICNPSRRMSYHGTSLNESALGTLPVCDLAPAPRRK